MLQTLVCGILVVRANSLCARLAAIRTTCPGDDVAPMTLWSGPTDMLHDQWFKVAV